MPNSSMDRRMDRQFKRGDDEAMMRNTVAIRLPQPDQ